MKIRVKSIERVRNDPNVYISVSSYFRLIGTYSNGCSVGRCGTIFSVRNVDNIQGTSFPYQEINGFRMHREVAEEIWED